MVIALLEELEVVAEETLDIEDVEYEVEDWVVLDVTVSVVVETKVEVLTLPGSG